jgi:hypothetical protein
MDSFRFQRSRYSQAARLYDLMLFAGDSPINMLYMGLYRFTPGINRCQYEDRRRDPETAKKEQENTEA